MFMRNWDCTHSQTWNLSNEEDKVEGWREQLDQEIALPTFLITFYCTLQKKNACVITLENVEEQKDMKITTQI
jgi:hypothetical protein